MLCNCRCFNLIKTKEFFKPLLKEAFEMAKVIRLTHTLVQDSSEKPIKSEDRQTSHGTNGFKKSLCPFAGIDKEALAKARASLLNNKVISIPTDTIYGVTGLAQSTQAVKKIYEIKSRSFTNPIAICVGEIEEIKRWANVTVSDDLLRELLPGPVTLVFERTADLNPDLNPHTNLVGVRIPDHAFIRALCRSLEKPLALTSANTSGAQSTLSVEEFENLWPELDLVLDGGRLGDTEESRKGSTVVNLATKNEYVIIRPGSAKARTIETLQKYGLSEGVIAS